MDFFEYFSKRYERYITQPWNKSVLNDFTNYINKDIIISNHPINQYLILSYVILNKKMIDVCCLSIFELLDIFVGRNEEYESLSDINCDLLIIENVACTYFKQKENLVIQMIESQKRLGRKCIFVSPLDLSYYKDYNTNTSQFKNLNSMYSKVVISNKYKKSNDDYLTAISSDYGSNTQNKSVNIDTSIDLAENLIYDTPDTFTVADPSLFNNKRTYNPNSTYSKKPRKNAKPEKKFTV